MLVDWARGVYQDLTCTFNEEGEYNKNHAGSKNKSQNSEHNYSHPLQNIEEELKRLKAKHIKTEFSKRESKEYKSSFENIEQELLSIKKKYKL